MLLIFQLALRMRHAIVKQTCMVIFTNCGRHCNKDRLGELPESRVQ